MEPEFKWLGTFLGVTLVGIVAVVAGAVAVVSTWHLGAIGGAFTAIVAIALSLPVTAIALLVADRVGTRAEAKRRG